MRRKSIILTVFLTVLTALAVLPAAAQLSAGVVGGLNLAQLRYEPHAQIDLKGRTAFGIGAVINLGLGADSDLHLEPMLLQKGGTRTADGIDNKISLSYFEIPVMIRFQLSSSKTKPYLMAGPSFGFVMSANVEATVDGIESKSDMKDEVKSLDFGLGFGLGVEMEMGRGAFFFEGRYAFGSTDINDLEGSNNPEVKTSGIQFFAGYTILLSSL